MPASFSRRSFLAVLGLSAATPAVSAARPARAPVVVGLLGCPVAGLAYYDHERVAGTLRVGDDLVLRRQPSNPHDGRAIEVLTRQGAKLGYVPRVDNAALASLMDAGYVVRAEVTGLAASGWQRVQMAVSLIDLRDAPGASA